MTTSSLRRFCVTRAKHYARALTVHHRNQCVISSAMESLQALMMAEAECHSMLPTAASPFVRDRLHGMLNELLEVSFYMSVRESIATSFLIRPPAVAHAVTFWQVWHSYIQHASGLRGVTTACAS